MMITKTEQKRCEEFLNSLGNGKTIYQIEEEEKLNEGDYDDN